MINLLPPEDRRQLRASRSNSLLLRYNIFLLGALVFLGLAIGATYLYLSATKAQAEQTIRDNEVKVAEYASVQADAEKFRSNLKTAKEILDKEVTYTKAILAISNILPDGITTQTLSLDVQTFGTPTTLTFSAKSVEAAIKLKDALQNSEIFSEVHFQSIETAAGADASEYPVTVNLNVKINKEVTK